MAQPGQTLLTCFSIPWIIYLAFSPPPAAPHLAASGREQPKVRSVPGANRTVRILSLPLLRASVARIADWVTSGKCANRNAGGHHHKIGRDTSELQSRE